MTLEELGARMTPVPPGKYLIGLSGGADSVALLMMTAKRAAEAGLTLEACHVNHGLRGAASDGDEAFCAALCERMGIPLHRARIDLQGRRDENTARSGRMACFRQWVRESGARGILLAHHRDDAAETLLMHLMRGAGPDGLGGMSAESEVEGLHIYRPMLALGREEIREALRSAGQPWREDESNGDDSYLRNAVRHRLLPEMERLAPGAAGRMAATAGMLARDRQWMNAEAEAFLRNHSGKGWIRAEAVRQLPEALRVRVLREWWLRDGPERDERQLNSRQTEELMRLCEAGSGIINLPGGYRAVRTGRNLHLTDGRRFTLPETPWGPPETTVGADLTLRQTASGGNPGDGRRIQEIPEGWFTGCVIRSRKPGDRIRPFGSGHTRKLQDYLTDRGIDEPWRDRVPLVCRGNEVLWAGGVGTGDIPLWDARKNMVRLTWTGDMPWAGQGEEQENG